MADTLLTLRSQLAYQSQQLEYVTRYLQDNWQDFESASWTEDTALMYIIAADTERMKRRERIIRTRMEELDAELQESMVRQCV